MRAENKKIQFILTVFFTVMCVLVIFPFILVVSVSFSNEQDIIMNGYSIIPKNFDLSAYKYLFKNPMTLLNAYKVTTIFSVIFMVLSVLLMMMIAYPLTINTLKGRRVMSFYLYFTMLFSGGLVPSYILITQYLHLSDNILVYILPGLISPWYVFMMRTFVKGVPNEIRESVKVDGGSEFLIFFKFILPLSKPVIASVALFMFLDKWNDWNTSMLYINSREDLISLQYMLQRILKNLQLIEQMESQGLMTPSAVQEDIPAETVRMAMSVLVAGPALFVFPFFQKYFVKGLTVGSVKG